MGTESNRLMAIELLLEGKSRAQVAEAAGVTERTLYSWLNRTDFQDALRERLRAVYGYTMARLTGSIDTAISTLQQGCEGEANASQIRAATAVLNSAVALNAAIEQDTRIQDALDRLAQLEEQREREAGSNGHRQVETVRTWAD